MNHEIKGNVQTRSDWVPRFALGDFPGSLRADFGDRRNLILGDTFEILAKGMHEALKCRELLGHDDHPELALGQAETSCVVLDESQPLFYVRLTGKHLDEQLQPARLIGLSHQRGVLEACSPLPPYANKPSLPFLSSETLPGGQPHPVAPRFYCLGAVAILANYSAAE
jgi:hypothetical protein